MNIFYSWQSDTPTAIGKLFVRLALDRAVEIIAADLALEEAERPTVDQDTQGVMGQPAIAETIFAKIRDADVVVVDVTLVGQVGEAKKLINSNVMYELGYAHGHHGAHVLLAVMNTHYGPPSDLPFDLLHRRWPVEFDVAPGVGDGDRRAAREALAQKLAPILRLYLENRPPGKLYEPIPSTHNLAAYWDEEELLINVDRARGYEDGVHLGYLQDQPLSFLRVWPDEQLPDLTGVELRDYQNTAIQPLLGRTGGHSTERNRYGTIAYGGANAGYLIAATQVFKNREIWGTDAHVLRDREEFEHGFVPTAVFEQGMVQSLDIYLDYAFNRLGYGDRAHVQAGMVNVRDYRLAMPNNFIDGMWGPLYEDVTHQGVVVRGDPSTYTAFLLGLFEQMFDVAGATRPDNLHNFPGADTVQV